MQLWVVGQNLMPSYSSHLGSREQHIHNVHTNCLTVVKRKYINFVQYIFIIVLLHYCQFLTMPYLQVKNCHSYICVVVEMHPLCLRTIVFHCMKIRYNSGSLVGKDSCHQIWRPEFNPLDPCGRRKEWIPSSWPLTSTSKPCHAGKKQNKTKHNFKI